MKVEELFKEENTGCIIMDTEENLAIIKQIRRIKSANIEYKYEYGCFGGVPSQYGCSSYNELHEVLNRLNAPRWVKYYKNIVWKEGEFYLVNITKKFNKDSEYRIIGRCYVEGKETN